MERGTSILVPLSIGFCGHSPLQTFCILASELHLTKRKVKESLLVRRTPNSMKLEKGVQLDNIWYPSIKHLIVSIKTTSKFNGSGQKC